MAARGDHRPRPAPRGPAPHRRSGRAPSSPHTPPTGSGSTCTGSAERRATTSARCQTHDAVTPLNLTGPAGSPGHQKQAPSWCDTPARRGLKCWIACDQRDAAKDCPPARPLRDQRRSWSGGSARLPRARSSDLHLAALAETPAAPSSPTATTASPRASPTTRSAPPAQPPPRRQGMSHEDIASAMGLSVADIRAWLTSPTH